MSGIIKLWKDKQGAVAPTVALSLVALIASGGLAFDYARLAAMDTELQSAADHAALAAATQLDGLSGACGRAGAAAASLLANESRFANDGSGRAVSVASESECDSDGSVRFYVSYDEATDTPGDEATSDATAKVVIVSVTARRADYALTPIVGAISSGNIGAEAVATLSGAICKVPPLMMCNPNEATGSAFPTSSDVGKGLKLEAGGGGSWAPGNYGYLDFGNGANTLERAMGANTNSEPCVDAATVATKPGNSAGVPAGINTRFDIYQNGLVAYCASSSGNCSPALVTIKDLVRPAFTSGAAPNEVAASSDNCAFFTGNNSWEQPTKRYLPDATTRQQATAIGTPQAMGLPRDICHAVSSGGDCGGTGSRFGNGNWDRALYFQVNHASTDFAAAATWAGKDTSATTGSNALTRYDVYRWEIANRATLTQRRFAEARQRLNPQGNPVGQPVDLYAYNNARCAAPLAATTEVKDRRLLTAAVVNCVAGNVSGSTHIVPQGWVDLFVTEPSLNRDRTGQDQIYVEVVGVATRPNGQNTFQYFLRQRPRLLK